MGRPFTAADDADILRLRSAKMPFSEIDARLGRGRDMCRRRWCALQEQQPAKPTAPRACMTCRGVFESEGAHNRMCDPCATGATHDHGAPWALRLPAGRA